MALQVWLPLNGNFNNQGIYNYHSIVNNDAIVNNNGKLGNCMKIPTITELNYTPNINNESLTLAGWFKFNKSEIASVLSGITYSSTATTPTGNLIGNDNYGGIGLIWYGNNIYNSGSFTALNVMGSIRASQMALTTAFVVEFDKWIHLAVTWDVNNRKLAIYKDGGLVSQVNVNAFSNGDIHSLKLNYQGVYGGNGPGVRIPFYANDIRIYDHSLSKKEIKDISKGLVLHYKLNDLVKNEVTFNLSNENYTVSDYSSRTHGYITNNTYHVDGWQSGSSIDTSFTARSINAITLQPNTVYYLSFNCKCQNNTSVYFGNGTYCYTGLKTTSNSYIKPTEKVTLGTSYDGFVSLKLQTGSASTYYVNLGFDSPNLYGVGSYIEFKNVVVSLQKPDNYIVPNQQNIIYDCSGYKHNGTLYGTFMQNDVSPRDSYSVEFNGTNNSIGIGNLNTIVPDGTFTFNCWFKKNTGGWSSKGYETILGGPSGFELEAKSGATNAPSLVLWNWGKGSITYELDKWNMVTFVRTASNTKLYLNGVLGATGTTGSRPSGQYFIGTCRDSSSQNYKGLMSDARIYATALSDSDIKELYETVATIDKNGNLTCYEFDERGTAPQIGKNGVVKSDLFVEGQSKKFRVLSDGSIWVQLLHHNNPASNLFTASNCWNYDNGTNLYSALFLLKNGDFKNSQGQYEFLACEKLTSASTETLFRWKQTSNPSVSSTITGFSAISGSSSYNYRGLLTNGNYGCMHNGSTWWGCCGSYTPYQGGTPGFSNVITSGYLDLYVRVTENTVKGATTSGVTALYKEAIASNSFLEN